MSASRPGPCRRWPRAWRLLLAGMAAGGMSVQTGLAQPPSAGGVSAGPDPATAPVSAETCAVPDDLVYVDAKLPASAAAVAAGRPLRVAVIGTASSMGRGVSQPERAYPARLRDELRRQLGEPAVELTNLSRPRWQAEEMLAAFPSELMPLHPDLVIWQTGTTDAIAGVAPDAFEQALDAGVDSLHGHGIDVILMDMQYNPHTITMISFDPYLEQFSWVAQVKDVLLFHRHDIMKWWIDSGVIGLSPETRPEQVRDADVVQGCIGVLLAGMVARAVRPPPESPPADAPLPPAEASPPLAVGHPSPAVAPPVAFSPSTAPPPALTVPAVAAPGAPARP